MHRNLGLLAALFTFTAAMAGAQTVGTPVYMAPYRAFTTSEFGVTFSDPSGRGWALEGAYRYGSGKFDIGLRGGFLSVDGPGNDDLYLLAGADLRFRVIEHTVDFPLDGAFTAGIGAQLGDNSVGLIPVGLSLGRRVELEGGVSFVPYLQPVLAILFGDGRGDEDALFAVGLGVDFKLSDRFDLRVTGGLGDEPLSGIGIGFAWVR